MNAMSARLVPLAAAAMVGTAARAEPAELEPRIFLHIRPEIRTNPAFQSGEDDHVFAVLQSARAGLDVKSGVLRGVVDFQGTESWGVRDSSTDTDPTVYVYQGFLQVGTGKNWLRLGRQEVHLHNSWHMSKAPWNVAGRTFDGFHGHVEAGKWEVDAFALVISAPFARIDPVPTAGGPVGVTTGPSLGETHAGVFTIFQATDTVSISPLLLSRAGGPTLDDPERSLWWVAPGARLYVDTDRTMVDFVGFGQVGALTDVPIRSYSTILRTRHGVGSSAWKPGVGLIFEQDSGSACKDDLTCDPDVIHDFQTGFGRNHFLNGNADQFRSTNIRDMGFMVDSTPWTGGKNRSLNLAIQGHYFQMVNPEGVWLSATGTLQGQGWEVGNTDPNLAWEIDALFDLNLTKTAHIDGGVCVVQPIGVGERLTGGTPMTYAFTRNRFTF